MNKTSINYTEDKEYSLSEIYYTLLKHKKIIFLSFFIFSLFTAYYTLTSKPIYQSKSVIMVSEEQNTMSFLDMNFVNDMNFIENEIEILKSRTTAEATVKKLINSKHKNSLHLFGTKQYEPNFMRKVLTLGYDGFTEVKNIENINDSLLNIYTKRLRSSIEVSNNRKTDLINISLKSLSPTEAALLVNTLVETYRKRDLEWVTGEMTHLKDFLIDQLEKKESELNEIEEKLKDFQEKEKIFTLDDNSKLLLKNLSEFETMYNNTLAGISILIERERYINEKLTDDEKEFSKKVSNTINARLFALKNEVAKLETELISTINQSGESHLVVKSLHKKINKLKENIELETRNLISKGISAADPISYRQVLIDSAISIKARMANLHSKSLAYNDLVKFYENKLQSLPEKLIDFTRLERQRRIQSETYAFMLQKLEESRIGEASKLGKIRVIDKAIPNNNPISPQKIINLFLGVTFGIGLGIFIAIAIEYFDNTISSIEQIERLGLPILALIPSIHKNTGSKNKKRYIRKDIKLEKLQRRLITHEDPKSPVSESYRSLRTSLMYTNTKIKSDDAITILISSPGPGEGKSTTIANLAITYANLGKKTLLVDSDLRKPVLHKVFNLDKTPGLTGLLSEQIEYENIIKKTSIENLEVVTSGIIPPNPSELLHSSKMEEFMIEAKKEYDVILFDSPPLVAVTDSYVLMKYISQFVLVLRAGISEKGSLNRVLTDFGNANFSITGVVVNDVSQDLAYGTGYYYNYYQYYYGNSTDI